MRIKQIAEEFLSKTIQQRQNAIAPKAVRDHLRITCGHDFDFCYQMCRKCGLTLSEFYQGDRMN